MENTTGRSEKRYDGHIGILFGESAPDLQGYIKNLSLGGIEIVSKFSFAPGTNLKIQIPQETVPIQGEGIVRWAAEEHPQAVSSVASLEMGLEFSERPEGYERFLEDTIERFEEYRREQRFEKVFKVKFNDPTITLEEYTNNISKGGMFIVTEAPLLLGSLVNVDIYVKEFLKIIHAEARIVHHVPREMADKNGLNPGFGVEFTQFFFGDDEVFKNYIDQLKDQLNELQIPVRDDL